MTEKEKPRRAARAPFAEAAACAPEAFGDLKSMIEALQTVRAGLKKAHREEKLPFVAPRHYRYQPFYLSLEQAIRALSLPDNSLGDMFYKTFCDLERQKKQPFSSFAKAYIEKLRQAADSNPPYVSPKKSFWKMIRR